MTIPAGSADGSGARVARHALERIPAARGDTCVNAASGIPRGLTLALVSPIRRCTRTACRQPAVATLTYVYRDSTAVVGPLATYAEPHCYDLCDAHSSKLTAPRGWELVRLPSDPDAMGAGFSDDDLEALANAVREAARPAAAPAPPAPTGELGRRGHLRVLKDLE
ncbi:MAG: hypothetical protein QOE64_898 [Frankiales bacterium]|nr:hypothetical protein [Frankiales bacterium]